MASWTDKVETVVERAEQLEREAAGSNTRLAWTGSSWRPTVEVGEQERRMEVLAGAVADLGRALAELGREVSGARRDSL